MVSLIQKYNISRFVTAYMCMCISLTNATACKHDIQIDTVRTQNAVGNYKDKNVPSGGSHAESIGGSIRTSRHSALLEVVDHSRCRTMFAVQSHERITRKKTPWCSASNHREVDGF